MCWLGGSVWVGHVCAGGCRSSYSTLLLGLLSAQCSLHLEHFSLLRGQTGSDRKTHTGHTVMFGASHARGYCVSSCTSISESLLSIADLAYSGPSHGTAWPAGPTLSHAELVAWLLEIRTRLARQRQDKDSLLSRADTLVCHSLSHSANRASLLPLLPHPQCRFPSCAGKSPFLALGGWILGPALLYPWEDA